MTYAVEAAKEWSVGTGANGYGKRKMIHGFFVVDGNGRRVRAFRGQDAEQKANDWAKFCTENMG